MLGRDRLVILWALQVLLGVTPASAQPVAVGHSEGVVHGFLVLRELDGTRLADGDLVQTAKGDRVTSRLTFRFKDGSLHDETTVFSQRRRFKVLSDHLVQKGPSFPQPIDVKIDNSNGRISVRYQEDGESKVASERIDPQDDLANGVILTLLKNLDPKTPETAASMVAATPKPRLVKLLISPSGEEPFTIGGSRRKATHYVVKVKLGGVAGLIAPILGKQPPDSHVWIMGGEVPAFVKSEGPLYGGGPIWRIELASPAWPSDQG